jgi:hypothetical protein
VNLPSVVLASQAVTPKDNSAREGNDGSTLTIYQHFRIFREHIEHEDGLVDEGLLWNINIQGVFVRHVRLLGSETSGT